MIPEDLKSGLPSGDQVEIQKGCLGESDKQLLREISTQLEKIRTDEGGPFEWSSITSSQFQSFVAAHQAQVATLIKEFGVILLRAYYVDPRVRDAIGVGQRAPFPLGYNMPENDLYALEPVYDRGRIYREVEQ